MQERESAGASPFVREGEVIGNYRVAAQIGAGAAGIVVRGEPLSGSGDAVALKVQPPISEALGETIRITLRASTILAAVQHPNVCRVFESGFLNDGRSFVAMELLRGVSLRDTLKQTRLLTERRTLDIARQLLSALAVVHRAGIVHRDIKPPNIHLEPGKNGQEIVKLIDFGIAHIEGSREAGEEGSRKKVIYGTATYVSPEQIRGQAVDGRADLYAVGVLLYRLLTGSLPFAYEKPAELYKAHLSEAPKKPRELNPLVTPFVEAVVLKALNKKPEARFQSAEEFLQAIEEAWRADASRRDTVPGQGPVPEAPPERGTNPAPLWPVGLAVGLAAGLLAGALLAPAAPADVPLAPRRSIHVESTPAAQLLRREVPLGDTPLTVTVKPGEWLVLRTKGYQDFAFQIGAQDPAPFSLREAPPAPNPPPSEPEPASEPESAPASASAPSSQP